MTVSYIGLEADGVMNALRWPCAAYQPGKDAVHSAVLETRGGEGIAGMNGFKETAGGSGHIGGVGSVDRRVMSKVTRTRDRKEDPSLNAPNLA